MITKEDFKVIEINPNSTNLIFIDHGVTTKDDAYSLSKFLIKKVGVNFGAIVLVDGNPNEAVKLISTEDLK